MNREKTLGPGDWSDITSGGREVALGQRVVDFRVVVFPMRRNLDVSKTLFALSSGSLPSAVADVSRLSGLDAFSIARRLFQPASTGGRFNPRTRLMRRWRGWCDAEGE